jgi:hypothetical protein
LAIRTHYFLRAGCAIIVVGFRLEGKIMRTTSRRRVLKGIGALAVLPIARLAAAQAGYPAKPIKIIAPVQPGTYIREDIGRWSRLAQERNISVAD